MEEAEMQQILTQAQVVRQHTSLEWDEKLKKAGIDPEELKIQIVGGKKSSPFDLYKDTQGNIYVKLKGGKSPSEPTDVNINDL